MKKMTCGRQGLQLIKDCEGLRLEAYKCPAGVPTIGYGHTKGVKMGQKITETQADDFLVEDIGPIERELNKLGINFRQEQFDSLVSWIFNLGQGNFNSSTMRRYITLDKGDVDITDQMVKWVNAGGKPLLGLKKRRIAEANMFLGYDKYYLDKNNNIKKR
jgi:lysozyme